MGQGSRDITADSTSKDNGPGSGEANDVGSSPQEDRGVSTGEVAED